MADAGIDLSIRTDSSQANAEVREVEEAIRRAGRTSEDASRRSADATRRNLQLYRDETRIMDLRARGRNDIADALRAEVDMRRMGLRLERELRVSEEEGLRMARRRVALERELAEQAARRGAGGAGGPGGGPPPQGSPPGGGPPRPPGGGPPRRGGGPPPPPGPNRGRDLNDAYNIAQDLAQGGLSAIANQVPIIVRLLRQYGGRIARVVSSVSAVVGTGVAIGYSLVDPQGAKQKLVDFANKLDRVTGAVASPASVARAFMTWLTKITSGANAMDKVAEASDKALKAYKVRSDQELARRTGDAEGGSARNRAAGQQASRESREGETGRLEDERERRMQLERLRLEGILNVEKKTKALAEFDKKWLTEKAERTRKIAMDEFEWASTAHAAAKAELDALEKRADKERLAAGASGTSAELEKINAARGGLKEAAQMTANALREAAKARTQAQTGVKTAADEGKIIDQRVSNFEADRAVEAVQQAIEVFDKVSNAVTEFAQEVSKKSKEIDKTRAASDRDMEILELRSRGQGRKADRLERQNSISDRVKELREKEGRSPEEAAKLAEREYDLRNPSRRIRGAGFGGPRRKGKNPSRTDFTGIDGVEYTGANGDGGLDVRSYNGLNGNGGLDGQTWGGANGDGGLDALRRLNDRSRKGGRGGKPADGPDGLDAIQNQNRKIRGAGFKGTRAVAEVAATAATAGVMPGMSAVLPALLGAINGLGKKLDTIASASRTIRR